MTTEDYLVCGHNPIFSYFFRDLLSFSLSSDAKDDSSKFKIDAMTGQIFVNNYNNNQREDLKTICPVACNFKARVFDGVHSQEISVRIVPLDDSQIIPLVIKNVRIKQARSWYVLGTLMAMRHIMGHFSAIVMHAIKPWPII